MALAYGQARLGAPRLTARLTAALGAGTAPALAWRFANEMPVLKQGGGFWLRAS